MKKTLTVILAALLTCAAALSASAAWVPEKDVGNVKFDVQKITAEWTPDGVWSDGEYYEIDVKDTWISTWTKDDSMQETAQNLDFTLAMSWDEEAVYTYVTFTDPNGHNNTYADNPPYMWQAGSIQICAADADNSGDQRLEYGVSVTSDTNQQLSTIWGDPMGFGYTAPTEDFIVINNNDTLIYEVRTPYSAFTETTGEVGSVYGMNYVLSWGNDTEYTHTQIASGCCGDPGKDASLFAKITLTEAPVVEVVEDTVTTAPQTFDMGVIAAAAAAVSLAGVAVSRKRK